MSEFQKGFAACRRAILKHVRFWRVDFKGNRYCPFCEFEAEWPSERDKHVDECVGTELKNER